MVRVDLDHVRVQRFGQFPLLGGTHKPGCQPTVLARPEVFRLWPQDQRPYPRHCHGLILIR